MITTALALQFTRDTRISICRTNYTSLHHLLTLLRALNPSKSLMLSLHLKWTTRLNCERMDCYREHLNSGLNPPVIHHRHRTLQIVVLKSNVHQFRKTRYGSWYNPGQSVVSELQIEEIYAFGKVLEIRERIEEIRNDAGDTGVARVERSQVCAFGQITRNLPWAELAIVGNAETKDGKVPEREFFWTESVRRDESCVRSEGRLPEIDWESRLMVTTLPVDLSQLTLVQVHGSLEADQPEGAGERAAKSLDMTAASSQNERESRPSKRSKRRKDGAFWEDIAGGV
nr:hypothetical protein Iba_chr12bCG11740 [Ipomoea batatas]